MKQPSGMRRWIRLPISRSSVRRDIDDEISHHLAAAERDLIAAGMHPDAAREEARRRFGNVEDVRRSLGSMGSAEARRVRRADFWRGWWEDLLRSLRTLRREPAFALVVATTLALGLGANATMFRVLDRVLLRPAPHIVDDGTLSLLYFQSETPDFGRVTRTSQSYPVFQQLRQRLASTADLAAWWTSSATSGRGSDATSLEVTYVTPNYFSLLGVRPWFGRAFGDAEWKGEAVPGTVLTHRFALARFGSAEAAMGRSIPVNGRSYTVIGVAPPGFIGAILRPTDLFVNMQSGVGEQVGKEWANNKNMRWLQMVARRAPGISAEAGGAAATVAIRQVGRTLEKSDSATTVIAGSIIPARRPDGNPTTNVAIWLSGVTLLVLLVACANVANLMLARTIRRRRELAVHLALGVSHARVTRMMLSESVILGLLAGALAMVLSVWGETALRATLLSDMPWEGGAIDMRATVFVALLAVVAALLAGAMPAVMAARTPLQESLKSGAREGGGRRGQLRQALVVLQATFSVVLLVGAGLFVRSFQRASALDLGYSPRGVFVTAPDLSGLTRTREEFEQRWLRLEEAVRRLPGVERVAQTVTIPFESQWSKEVLINGDTVPPAKGGGPYVNAVSADYFRTMQTPLLRGRDFTPRDRQGAAPVVIVNENMAKLLWPGREALGQCFGVGGTPGCLTVVGVVADHRIERLGGAAPPHFFEPLGQWAPDMRSLIVRVAPSGGADANAIRRAILEAEPGVPYVRVREMSSIVDEQLQPWKLGALLFALFGALGLVVAALGLYSVIAHDVAQRAHEIGVRMALGARRGDVARLVVGRGVRQALLGVGIGLALAALASRRVADLLFETSPRDPLIYAGVFVILVLVALLAAVVPARRAARLEPVQALKEE